MIGEIRTAAPADTTRHPAARPDWALVGLLWFAFFLNQADRQAFNVVLPLIRIDLGVGYAAMGLIATAFTVVYGVFVPVAGIAGDYFQRKNVLIFSLLVFSSGTLLTGAASSVLLLIVFRSIATGAGEAFYAPAAASMIGETHVATRARALAVHQTANYTGVVLGSLLAGWIGARFGWRATFYAFGVAGLCWAALLVWRTRRYPMRVRPADAGLSAQWVLIKRSVGLVVRTPVLAAQLFAFGGLIFALTGFLTWTPTLLFERFRLPLAEAGFSAVFYHHLFAYVGVLATSFATDRLIGRFPGARLVSMALGLMACAPFIWWASEAGSLWQLYSAFAAFGLFRGIYDSSLFAALFDIVEDDLRSTMLGLLLASGFLIGATAPVLLGVLKAGYGLEGGLKLLAIAPLVTGGILLATALRTSGKPQSAA